MESQPLEGFTALLGSLSPDAHIRGKQFERVAKWWLTQDPIRSLDVKQAWLWDEWPERSGPDIGIDIVAEMYDGTLCAIQAKCFDENRDIPKSELDSFVSAASHRTFQHRWLIATTDRLSANARRMLDDQHVTRIMRSDLEESLDTWPTSVNELNPIQQVKSSPRPHQKLAINDVVKGLASSNRGQLIMACGTGKTLTALWIKETLKPRTTLVLVPSLNLLAQTLSEWAKNTSSPWNYLCVCSDDTVNKADDQPISTVGDLPFDVTTNAEQISSFLSLGGEKIIFSTYQSSSQVAKAQEQSGVSFDLVICDEAHRLTGKTAADYATVLDEKKIVSQKILFMTATPRTYTTAVRTKAKERGVEITSMDDEHIYGPVLHKLSFGEAIKQELLSDYRVLIVGVTDPQVQDLIDHRELVSVNDSVTTDARTLAAHIGLAKATKDYNLKRTISFHSRIKTADQFARDHTKILEWLPESHKPSGETWTGTISGAMNTGARRKLLTQLRLDGEDRHAILTNARCLTEGVDVPSLDGVAFIDPRSSQVDIIQAVGRAIRKSENKDVGTIVLPVLIPTDSDVEHALEDTAFKPIWAILNALKSHDETMTMELDNLRFQLGRTGRLGNLPNRIIEDLPINIDSLIPNFSHKFSIAVLEHVSDEWDYYLGRLSTLEEARIPRGDWDAEVRGLSKWITKQRVRYNKGVLNPTRISKLEQLPHWTWDPYEDDWQINYHKYCQYVQESNNANPAPALVWRDWNIGSWVNVQRQQFKTGFLPQHRIDLLESHSGFVWEPEKQSILQLVEYSKIYFEQHGHLSVPQTYVCTDGYPLGKRIAKRRWDIKTGRMKPEYQGILEALEGWVLTVRTDRSEDWITYLQRNYGKSEKYEPLSQKDLKSIKNWLYDQRKKFNKDSLEPEIVKILEELPNWSWNGPLLLWNVDFHQSWEDRYKELANLCSIYGSFNQIPTDSNNFKEMRSWCYKQRTRYRKKELAEDQVQLLENIPGWDWHPERWNERLTTIKKSSQQIWNERLETIERTSEDLGRARFSKSDQSWLDTQRRAYRENRLDKEQIKALENIPGWSLIPKSYSWEDYFNSLLVFSTLNGHCKIPTGYRAENAGLLSPWCTAQRKSYNLDELPLERIERLESIPSWNWNGHEVKDNHRNLKAWQAFYEDLILFAEVNGHSRVPKRFYSRSGRLHQWCVTQRKLHRSGMLDIERKNLLEKIADWDWNPPTTRETTSID